MQSLDGGQDQFKRRCDSLCRQFTPGAKRSLPLPARRGRRHLSAPGEGPLSARAKLRDSRFFSLFELKTNLEDDTLGVFEHLGVPETDDFEPCGLKITGALRIVGPLSRFIMLPAINLDDQSSLQRTEICEVRADRILATEFSSELPVPQSTPQALRGIR